MADDLNLAGTLTDFEREALNARMNALSPDDGRYGNASQKLVDFLSPAAEIRTCAQVHLHLLETRAEFGQASQAAVDAVRKALPLINPANVQLLEDKVTKHDQLALIEEIGRHVTPETKALLHPGTTSYDILDTARSYLLRNAWATIVRPALAKPLHQLAEIGEQCINRVQVGRTHLQDTSPVLFGGVMAGYAARLAERTERCDEAFSRLRGKISGMVGTGASIDMVVGSGKSLKFEEQVLKKLGLKPDYTATQVVQKEQLTDVGHSLVSLAYVMGDLANDMRLLYSSAIGEVTSRAGKARLGGSSADAGKNNPIGWENIAGKVAIIASGMPVLYAMIQTDFQRDLRGSVQARYQPQGMMTQTYESVVRLSKELAQLDINTDRLKENLRFVRQNPSEAMVAILRGAGWVHPEYGVGHDFVKEMGKVAQKRKLPLLDVALCDPLFSDLYHSATLTTVQKQILNGEIEHYIGSARERAHHNIAYARKVASRS